MLLKQFFDPESCTYSYLLADEPSRVACLIDPVLENIDVYLRYIDQFQLSLVYALDTHIHADHITALGELRDKTGCISLLGKPHSVECADGGLTDGESIAVGSLQLQVIYTPGHTDDSFCFYLMVQEQGYLFSGDTLLIGGTGRTDFQNGDAGKLYDSLHSKILKLPDDTIVYPGHDYKGQTHSTLSRERMHNMRIKVDHKTDFIALMNNLNLPHPKRINEAVPSNLSCGKELTDD